MKNFFVLVFLLNCFTPFAQEKIKDSVFTKAFAALKKNDSVIFQKLFPENNQLKMLADHIIANVSDSQVKATIKQNYENQAGQDLAKKIRQSETPMFSFIYENGTFMGVNWAEAVLDSTSLNVDQMHGTVSGVGYFSGHLYFHSNQKKFIIPFSQLIWLESQGWWGLSLQGIYHDTEKQAGSTKENNININMSDDLPPPPAPPSPAIKKKVEGKQKKKDNY